MTVVWTKEALARLGEIEAFIGRDGPRRGEQFTDYLIERGRSVAKNTEIGRVVPEISNPQIREVIARNYRIVYRLEENTVEILTVFEGHRLLGRDESDIDLTHERSG